MAAPTVVAHASAKVTTTTTSVTVTHGFTLQNGDVLYAFCSKHWWSGTWAATGWTNLINQAQTDGEESACAMLRKVVTDAGSEPTSYTFSTADSRAGYYATVIQVRGVDTTTPEDVASTANLGANNSRPPQASLTTVTNEALCLMGMFQKGTANGAQDLMANDPPGAGVPLSKESNNTAGHFTGYLVHNTAGLFSPGNWQESETLDTTPEWQTMTVAVRPTVPPEQTVSGVGGIVSLEALGTTTITVGDVGVGAGGIASGEAFGVAVLAAPVSPGAIASAEAFGTTTVTPGDVGVGAGGITSTETFGTTTVTPEGVGVGVGGIASGEAFGSATATVSVGVGGIASGESFGATTLTTDEVTVGVGAITSTETFGAVTVDTITTLGVGGIASGESFGTTTITPGDVGVGVGGIASAEAFGNMTTTLDVAVGGITSAETFGTATVTRGDVTVVAGGISSTEAFGTLTTTIFVADVGAIGSVEAFGTATLLRGDIGVGVGGMVSAEAFGVPAFDAGTARIEHDDQALAYGPHWETHVDANHHGGSATRTRVVGAHVDVTFEGTGVSVLVMTGPDQGLLRVNIDGITYREVDLYAPSYVFRRVMFSELGLKLARHTMRLSHGGRGQGRSQTGDPSEVWLTLDAVDLVGDYRRVEVTTPVLSGSGLVVTRSTVTSVQRSRTGPSVVEAVRATDPALQATRASSEDVQAVRA